MTENYREFLISEYARKVAKMYDTDHHEILYSKEDYFDEWPNLIDSKGGVGAKRSSRLSNLISLATSLDLYCSNSSSPLLISIHLSPNGPLPVT